MASGRIPFRIVYTEIPSYYSLDVRLAWKLKPNLELSLVGQNLLDENHPEYYVPIVQSEPTEIQRGVYVKGEWKW